MANVLRDSKPDARPAAGERRVRYTGTRWDVEEYRAGERHPYLIGSADTEADARLLAFGGRAVAALERLLGSDRWNALSDAEFVAAAGATLAAVRGAGP